MSTWHLITSEYPPAPGGVSDYTAAVAAGLAQAGDEVHVWCPAAVDHAAAAASPSAGVTVHAIAGSWSRPDRDRLDAALNEIPGAKHLLVQWVPHAFGRRSMNIGFCRWMRRRAGAGDVLDVMVHEPGLGFGEGSLQHNAAAAVHRVMLALLLDRARQVWISIPAWAEVLRPWAFRRDDLSFEWLPVPSNVPVQSLNGQVGARRTELLGGAEGLILGHFSTYPASTRLALRELLPPLLAAAPDLHVQLLGRGAEAAAGELETALGRHAARVHVSPSATPARLSRDLQSCDLLLQPYADGASSRRTTLMAALAHGLPVVTTTGRLSEPLWKESNSVAAMAAGDLPGLARTVLELARQPEKRQLMSAAARETYQSRFSIERSIQALRRNGPTVNR